MTDAVFLDEGQYRPAEIRKYEAIYGRDFVSPGGEVTARKCIAMLELSAGAQVLDAGCGLGGSAYLMAREYAAQVVGIDLSANMIASARRRCAELGLDDQVTFRPADLLALDACNAFDAIYSRDAFLHIADKARLFSNLYRALRPGGRLLITDYCTAEPPRSEAFMRYQRERAYDLRAVSAYVAALESAGFTDIHAEDRTAEFIEIHTGELARLSRTGLDPTEVADLQAGWQAKIERARQGEQRWGLFTAIKAA